MMTCRLVTLACSLLWSNSTEFYHYNDVKMSVCQYRVKTTAVAIIPYQLELSSAAASLGLPAYPVRPVCTYEAWNVFMQTKTVHNVRSVGTGAASCNNAQPPGICGCDCVSSYNSTNCETDRWVWGIDTGPVRLAWPRWVNLSPAYLRNGLSVLTAKVPVERQK